MIIVFFLSFLEEVNRRWDYLSLMRMYSVPPSKLSIVDYSRSIKSPFGTGLSLFQITKVESDWKIALFPLNVRILLPLTKAEEIESYGYGESAKAEYYPLILDVYGGGSYWLESHTIYAGVDLEYSPMAGISAGVGFEFQYDILSQYHNICFGLNLGFISIWVPGFKKEY